MGSAADVLAEVREALRRAEGEPDYPALLRELCLWVDAEKARLQAEGRFWCAQSIGEGGKCPKATAS